jgi:acyl-coenzyme A thioesterase PaaI-like protein
MKTILKLMWLWPPFLGAGIRVERVSPDLSSLEVSMKLRFWNRNYVGSHYGGSLFSMTDPFFALMLIHNLGRNYIVWDKAATIHFRKPGKGRVRVLFELSRERLEEIRAQAERDPKVEPVFKVEIRDESGDVVAEVEKTLYVRRKKPD